MSEKFRSPMLAKEYDRDTLTFPRTVSPKVDGIRCVIDVFNGVLGAYSRSGKLIPNKYVQSILAKDDLIGLDGELTIGRINAPDVFNCTYAVTRIEGEPDFIFNVFDHRGFGDTSINSEFTYQFRRQTANDHVDAYAHDRVQMLESLDVNSLEEFDQAETDYTARGFEGMMARLDGVAYKFGRSSPKHGGLLKVKRFEDAEATIIGFKELMHNGNEAEINELGRTKRSSAKEGLIGGAMMGAYICTSPDYAETFDISCGSMKWADRARAWATREEDKGRLIRYKHLPHGAKNRPRHGLFAGFRHPDDLS